MEPKGKIEIANLTGPEPFEAHYTAASEALARENDLKKSIQAVAAINYIEMLNFRDELKIEIQGTFQY